MRSSLASSQANHEAIILQPEGALNTNTVTQFYQSLHTAVSCTHCSNLVVDMKQVDQIDRAGLMALISAFKLSQKFSKQLLLCSVSCPVRMVLELTQLDTVFNIVEPHSATNDESLSGSYSILAKRELAMQI